MKGNIMESISTRVVPASKEMLKCEQKTLGVTKLTATCGVG